MTLIPEHSEVGAALLGCHLERLGFLLCRGSLRPRLRSLLASLTRCPLRSLDSLGQRVLRSFAAAASAATVACPSYMGDVDEPPLLSALKLWPSTPLAGVSAAAASEAAWSDAAEMEADLAAAHIFWASFSAISSSLTVVSSRAVARS